MAAAGLPRAPPRVRRRGRLAASTPAPPAAGEPCERPGAGEPCQRPACLGGAARAGAGGAASPSVTLHVYDVAGAATRGDVQRLLPTAGDEFFHCTVEVHSTEWSYGETAHAWTGVCGYTHLARELRRHRESVAMGATELSEDEVVSLAERLQEHWHQESYDIITCNSAHFCSAFCVAMGTGRAPTWVTNLAKVRVVLQDLPDNERGASHNAAVALNIYDVTGNAAVQGVNRLLRVAGSGAFHAGIEVFGCEWSFALIEGDCTGVFSCSPRSAANHTYRESVPIGSTELACDQVANLLVRLAAEWVPEGYDFLNCNCCHFCEALSLGLGVGGLPAWVTNLASAGTTLQAAAANINEAVRSKTGDAADFAVAGALALDDRLQVSATSGFVAAHAAALARPALETVASGAERFDEEFGVGAMARLMASQAIGVAKATGLAVAAQVDEVTAAVRDLVGPCALDLRTAAEPPRGGAAARAHAKAGGLTACLAPRHGCGAPLG